MDESWIPDPFQENNALQEEIEVHARGADSLYSEILESIRHPPIGVNILSFPRLSKMIGGLRPNEFTILCGATGIGKTTLVANLSASLLEQKVPHFVASVETGALDFGRRVLSVLANEDLNHGERVSKSHIDEIGFKYRHHFDFENLRLSLYEDRFSVETLMAEIKQMREDHGIKIAIIDNLSFFLDVTTAQNSVTEMDRVIHELIIFCKSIDVHIVMVMHPKKTDHGRVNSEFDIKGSSTAVQEAHNILLFNRASKEAVEDLDLNVSPGDRELKLAKCRRKGKHTGMTLFLKTDNGVRYNEAEITRI